MNTIHESLKDRFGFDAFRPGQEQTVSQLVAGQSSLAIFPTGSGKSLCYQLAALHLPNLTLVVSPLLALIQDQLQFLKGRGISAASLDSTLSHQEYQDVVSNLKQGNVKVLMVSVERFKNERFRQLIQNIPISMLVVDEAHCISEWGHNFRPDYLKLPSYREDLNIPTVLLLTATATRKVKLDMAKKFGIEPEHIVQTGFYRNNLELDVQPIANDQKVSRLCELLPQLKGCGIVYVTLQQQAEMVAQQLSQNGIDAQPYHAGMDNDHRQSIQRGFMSGDIRIIVATIAFGMGVDKSDIRFVIHYDLPKSIENYSQEIGRAGRDGLTSKCITFANLDGLNTLENFVYGDTPEPWSIDALLAIVASETANDQWEMQANAVSFDTNIRLLTLKTVLVQLELQGVLKAKYSYFSEYRLKYHKEPNVILAMFEGERAKFLSAVFKHCKRKRTWADVDITAIENSYATDRNRVLTALEYLQDQGLVELQSKGAVDVYGVDLTMLQQPSLAGSLIDYFQDKEKKEVARIQQLVRFFELDRCLTSNLARYFDDQNAPEQCGHCSVCSGRVAKLKKHQAIDPLNKKTVNSMIAEMLQVLEEKLSERKIPYNPTSVLITNYLVGLTMPWFTRFKFRQLKGFGRFELNRYQDVKNCVEQNQKSR